MEAEVVAKGEAQVQAERERLYRELAVAKDQALQQMMNQAADLAAMISTKAVRRQLNADDHRRLLDEALDDMREAVAQRQARQGTTA
jgi:F-type H+-transporting ATPase subunit b